jgi:hypothetical protein
MIPALTVGVIIGTIIGLAIVAWRHAATIAPPAPSVDICVIGLDNGQGGHYLDPHFARMLKPILEKLGMEVKL